MEDKCSESRMQNKACFDYAEAHPTFAFIVNANVIVLTN
jgi:hypothetical protein